MYERWLDPNANPDIDALAAYCGEGEALFRRLNDWMTDTLGTAQTVRFPYGKQYGWGVKHSVKAKHICDVFAERGACNVMLRLSGAQIERAYPAVSASTRDVLDHRYPCGDGGWVHLRVADEAALADAQTLLAEKLTK